MEFLDRNGHIFSLPSYVKKPIGYEYDLNDYIFWIDSPVTSKLSINNYYVKCINLVVPFAFNDDTSVDENIKFDILIDKSSVFSLLSPALVSDLVNKNEDIMHYISIDDTQLSSELTNDDLMCMKVSDDYSTSTNNYLVVPIYVVANASEVGTWNTNILVHINYITDQVDDWCSVSVGGEFEDVFEELEINGLNTGVKLPKEIIKAVYQESFYNDEFNEALYNEKLKEFLVNFMDIRGQRGNFSSVINSLNWFGYGDKISISKLLKTDNNIMSQYVNDYFDINSDLIESFNKFKNTSYVSLKIMSNAETGDHGLMKVDSSSYETFIEKLPYYLEYEFGLLINNEKREYQDNFTVVSIVNEGYEKSGYLYPLQEIEFDTTRYKISNGDKTYTFTLTTDDTIKVDNDHIYKIIEINDNVLTIEKAFNDDITIEEETVFTLDYNFDVFAKEDDYLTIETYNEDKIRRELYRLYRRFVTEGEEEDGTENGVFIKDDIDKNIINFFVHEVEEKEYEDDPYYDSNGVELAKRTGSDFWGEGKPVLEDLFNKYVKVNDGTPVDCAYNYWKPYYDYCFNELAIKLSCLKYYYEEYFLPIHLKVHSASVAHQVHMNDIKLIQQSNEGVNEAPIYIQDEDLYVSQEDGQDEVEFENHHYVWLTKQIHFVDDQYNEWCKVNKDDSLFYINDTCCNIPIRFKSTEKPYNCVLLLEKYRDVDVENPYKSYINYKISSVIGLDINVLYSGVLQDNDKLWWAYTYDKKTYSPYYLSLDKMIDGMLASSKISNYQIRTVEIIEDTYEYYVDCDDIFHGTKYEGESIKLTYERQSLVDDDGNYTIFPSISELSPNPMDHSDVVGSIYVDVKPMWLSFKTDVSDKVSVVVNDEEVNINNVKINMIPETDLVYESHFTVCQHDDDFTKYRDFVIYPKMLNNMGYYDYWINERFKISLLVNGKWYSYEFVIKMPECKIDMGTLEYKYFISNNNLEEKLKMLYGEYYTDDMTVCYLFKNILLFEYETHMCNTDETENIRRYGKAVDIVSGEVELVEFGLEDDSEHIKNTFLENVYSDLKDNLIDNNIISKFSQVRSIDDDRVTFNSFMWEPKLVTTNHVNFFKNFISNAFSLNTRYLQKSDIDDTLFVALTNENNATIYLYRDLEYDETTKDIIESSKDNMYVFKYGDKFCFLVNVHYNVYMLLTEDEMSSYVAQPSSDGLSFSSRYSLDNLSQYVDKYVHKSNIGLLDKYKNKMYLFDIYETYTTTEETLSVSPNIELNANGIKYSHGLGKDPIYLYGVLNPSQVSDTRKLDVYTIMSYDNGIIKGFDGEDDISIQLVSKFKCYIEVDENGDFGDNPTLSHDKTHDKLVGPKLLGTALYQYIGDDFDIYNYIKTDIPLFKSSILTSDTLGVCYHIDDEGRKTNVTYKFDYVDIDGNHIEPTVDQLKYNVDIYYLVSYYYDEYQTIENVEFEFPMHHYSTIWYDKDNDKYYAIYIDGSTEYTIDNISSKFDYSTMTVTEDDGTTYECTLVELVKETGVFYYDAVKKIEIPDYQPGLWYWNIDNTDNTMSTYLDTLTQWSFEDYDWDDENQTNSLIEDIQEFINKRDDKTLREDFNYDYTPERVNETLKYEDYYDNMMVKVLDPSQDYGIYTLSYELSDELSSLEGIEVKLCASIKRADGIVEYVNDNGNDTLSFTLNEDDIVCIIYLKIEGTSSVDLTNGDYWIKPSLKKQVISTRRLAYNPNAHTNDDISVEDDTLDGEFLDFTIDGNQYRYGYNMNKYTRDLYDDFFTNVMSISAVNSDDYYIDEIYSLYEGNLMISTPYLEYDFYLMHDNEYWYGVYISKSTMEYVSSIAQLKISNVDDDGYLQGSIKSKHYDKTYTMKYVGEDEQFLINRYYYKSSGGRNHFSKDDLVVAYVENNDRLPVNIYQGTKWKIDPLTIGVNKSDQIQSSTEMTLINYPDKSNNYYKGYYNLTVRYCVDRDNNHQQTLVGKFRIS